MLRTSLNQVLQEEESIGLAFDEMNLIISFLRYYSKHRFVKFHVMAQVLQFKTIMDLWICTVTEQKVVERKQFGKMSHAEGICVTFFEKCVKI